MNMIIGASIKKESPIFFIIFYVSANSKMVMSLKKYLQQFSKEQLVAQIIELNAKYKDVKTYYEFSINPNSDKAKKEAKKIIMKNINTDGSPKLKLREARQAVTNFKKLSPTESDLADIMLFY